MTTTGRRALLTAGVSAAAATALAGCTSEAPGPRKPSAAEREAERVARAEANLRLRSVTASRTLLERYDAALAAHPALAPRLAPLRRSVAAHTKALGEGGTTVRPATASPTASPTAVASAPAPVPVAADPGTALRDLAAAERTASDAHTAALLTAPPEYARLLASVAAAGAAHAYLLTEGARA
ncbi:MULTISPECIES: hypothetical protein [Streptomyces]|uniref:hypothetical protein n=1 Tax=Streptomyces TaxID=1883 RepID=UPI0009398C46|nr:MULTISPECIES: hypothetical protein [Streptomyces]MBX9422616.1 hypothetical protein [Streptomyces lateritius]OKJ53718.1 hypothetical protein AMK29_29340 [Streptomyces sp. CB02261]